MADKGGLQLLPETRKRIEIKVPGENRWIYTGMVLCALVLAIYGGLWSYQNNLNNKISDIDNQLTSLENQRNKKTEGALLVIAKQLKLVSDVFDNHLYWTTGFSKIEASMQNKVQFKSLVSDKTGLFRMHAVSDNYTTIAKQLAAFVADDSVKDVILNNVSTLNNGQLDFNAQITFDKSKFLARPK